MPYLTILLVAPVIAALGLIFLPKDKPELYKMWALVWQLGLFVASVPLYFQYQAAGFEGFILSESVAWIPTWNVNYELSLDGISLVMVLLTTFLGPIVALGAWSAVEKRHKEFWFHVLILQAAMLGTFLAADLVLFFVFWEAMLVPMYFLIGVWGGAKRKMATIKFFIFTAVGSLLMMIGVAWLGVFHQGETGQLSFAYADLLQLHIPATAQYWLFGAFALAFAIKVPMWPVHTWLPDAHTEAPTTGSVILAGVLLKMGTYGFVRLAMPLFPDAVFMAAPLMILLAVIGIVYGALVAMVQPDIKRLVAYSSVSHLGYCMLGLFALNLQGVQGSILQGLNHGISTGALFLLVGMVYERTHTREISDYGGLAKLMPIYATAFLVVTMSSIGLPGTNGFVGEFLILLGGFRNAFGIWQAGGSIMHLLLIAVAASGVIFGAVYMLWMVQRVFFGPVSKQKKVTQPHNEPIKDLNKREMLVIAPLIIMIFWIGIFPKTFLAPIEKPVTQMLDHITERAEHEYRSDPAQIVNMAKAKAHKAAGAEHGAEPAHGGDSGAHDSGESKGGHC